MNAKKFRTTVGMGMEKTMMAKTKRAGRRAVHDARTHGSPKSKKPASEQSSVPIEVVVVVVVRVRGSEKATMIGI